MSAWSTDSRSGCAEYIGFLYPKERGKTENDKDDQDLLFISTAGNRERLKGDILPSRDLRSLFSLSCFMLRFPPGSNATMVVFIRDNGDVPIRNDMVLNGEFFSPGLWGGVTLVLNKGHDQARTLDHRHRLHLQMRRMRHRKMQCWA